MGGSTLEPPRPSPRCLVCSKSRRAAEAKVCSACCPYHRNRYRRRWWWVGGRRWCQSAPPERANSSTCLSSSGAAPPPSPRTQQKKSAAVAAAAAFLHGLLAGTFRCRRPPTPHRALTRTWPASRPTCQTVAAEPLPLPGRCTKLVGCDRDLRRLHSQRYRSRLMLMLTMPLLLLLLLTTTLFVPLLFAHPCSPCACAGVQAEPLVSRRTLPAL
mmetsp:Transcript_74624/g.145884  ORF Transcript_74624/g.145884 Transcript_74624/m.145884 type:complete len:214 (+) Transcript_74624:560-1201(+)